MDMTKNTGNMSSVLVIGNGNITGTLSLIIYLSIKLLFFQSKNLRESVRISHLSPGERGYGHTRMSRMLNVTVLRGLSQTIQEVDSRKVSVGDFKHILGQCLGGSLVQREI